MDTSTVVTLLTIAVVLLSIVIIALLITVTVVLVKINKLVKSAKLVADNIALATAWLSPAKVIREISKIFRK